MRVRWGNVGRAAAVVGVLALAVAWPRLGGGVPPVPNPGEVLSQVEKCLRSGDLSSAACRAVLDSVNLVRQLRSECAKPKYDGNPVCAVVNLAPGGGDGGLPGLPGLPGLGDLLGRRLPDALSSGDPTPAPDPVALYGGSS